MLCLFYFFFFKQKTAYEMRISDWSSDVCSSDLVSNSLLEDLDKDTVDFTPNYDASETEPQVLPARFPNLLVNGAGGIAVGMATNIPPHNLGEVMAACLAYIDNPGITVDELFEIVPGPDFPTGGLILGKSGQRSAYQPGRGQLLRRSRSSSR